VDRRSGQRRLRGGLLARELDGRRGQPARADPLATPLDVAVDAQGAGAAPRGPQLARARAELALELRAPPRGAIAARAGGCRAMRTTRSRLLRVRSEPRGGRRLRVFPGWRPRATPWPRSGLRRVALRRAAGCAEFLVGRARLPVGVSLLESEASRALEPMVLAKLCVALDGELAR
jgi:hypothetical protein